MKSPVARQVAESRRYTTPIAAPRTLRGIEHRTLTSMPAGKMVPIAAWPLLREDSLVRSRHRLSFEMMETAEILMNAVNVSVKAYLVPWLAFDRFSGMDDFNRSYEGVAPEGLTVVPFFDTEAMGAHGADAIYKYLGFHAAPGTEVNTAYVEAYNAIWNLRAANRSPDITLRTALNKTLAPAFWSHNGYRHIVPDFDQAKIDGEIALNYANNANILPVRGISIRDNQAAALTANARIGTVAGDDRAASATPPVWDISAQGTFIDAQTTGVPNGTTNRPQVFVEMEQNGITVSLSNIELAKKTAAFANLRSQYSGHTDDYIINLLMDALTVPEQAYRQPMLLAEKNTAFGYQKRYSTEAASLNVSAVNGATFVDLNLMTPRIATGGVIMIVAEATPEQIFERQQDPFFHLGSVAELPQYLRDELDPEKVEVVANDYIDSDHDTPNGVFGYAPLNHKWNQQAARIGGRFYRPAVNAAFDEDRQRIWAVETENPTLSQDFYICTTMHTKPFADSNTEPFEVVMRGQSIIEGHTVFGGALIEASTDYAEVLAEAPQDRIVK